MCEIREQVCQCELDKETENEGERDKSKREIEREGDHSMKESEADRARLFFVFIVDNSTGRCFPYSAQLGEGGGRWGRGLGKECWGTTKISGQTPILRIFRSM